MTGAVISTSIAGSGQWGSGACHVFVPRTLLLSLESAGECYRLCEGPLFFSVRLEVPRSAAYGVTISPPSNL